MSFIRVCPMLSSSTSSWLLFLFKLTECDPEKLSFLLENSLHPSAHKRHRARYHFFSVLTKPCSSWRWDSAWRRWTLSDSSPLTRTSKKRSHRPPPPASRTPQAPPALSTNGEGAVLLFPSLRSNAPALTLCFFSAFFNFSLNDHSTES